ncbi:MAG TPA: peptide-methionine (S)-S-oxide reductase MsrA [Candidatus Thermoplasmatota archaeon]
MTKNREVATFAGGCFWCLEAVYEQVQGVDQSVSGYAGGAVKDPSYEDVCSGQTGHAEVVQITYDPSVVTYRQLLEIFFTIHDPTQLNRQGADVGTQYRSSVFFHNPEQKEQAQDVMKALEAQELWPTKFVTKLEPMDKFYAAEEYHQQYFQRNPYQPYCRSVVAPKVAKFRTKWAKKLKGAVPAA